MTVRTGERFIVFFYWSKEAARFRFSRASWTASS